MDYELGLDRSRTSGDVNSNIIDKFVAWGESIKVKVAALQVTTERKRERWQPLTLDEKLSEDDVIIKNKQDVIFPQNFGVWTVFLTIKTST